MAPYEVIEQGQPIEKASKALILLHGRGGSALDILSLAPELCDETFYIAAPQTPHNSWYPNSFMAEEKLNEPWLSASVAAIKRLIDDTAQKIPKNQIYLLGFSQGACLALEVSARFATKYGGVIAFTGGLIGRGINPQKYEGNFEGTAVFIGNSDNDSHVPLVRSKQSKELMQKLGAVVTLRVYQDMPHTINQDEMDWAKNLLWSSR